MSDEITVCSESLPEYSVLMSVYQKDRPEWFEKAVDSMAGQSHPPKEMIVVEDGPIPEALRISEKRCMERYPNLIHIFTKPQNEGLAAAMRFGLSECECEWIARMDADDISAPTRCEEELRLAIREQADIVGCDCEEFMEQIENAQTQRMFPETHEELVRFSRRRTPFCHPAVMMKKTAVLQSGNYKDVYLHEDYDLFVRMFACGFKGCSVKKILYYVRIGRDFYKRRGGWKYVRALLGYNMHLLCNGWMKPKDFIIRSCGNIVVGLSPVRLRFWFYRRLLRK